MKHLSKLFLIMAILCLTGCSEDEEPQSVAFLSSEKTVPSEGGSFTVAIEANCPWTISEQSELVSVQQVSGDGNSTVRINVGPNTSYDDLSHAVTIASKNGTSNDMLTVKQERTFAVKAEQQEGTISCEGGTFTIPVNTNDNISKVETPEWITFTESRGLEQRTYAFTAEPNKTGSVRTGTVILSGEKSSATIDLSQDSYTPVSASLILPDTMELTEFPVTSPLEFSPEYADFSKISAHTTGGTVQMSDGEITVDTDREGQISIVFSAGGQNIGKKEITAVSSFDADSVLLNLPDSIAISDTPYVFPIITFPEYAKAERLSVEARGAEAVLDGKNLELKLSREEECLLTLLSSGKEIYTKAFTSYDPLLPTAIEVDAPDYLIQGRNALHYKVYPEGSDISKLQMIGNHGCEISIEGDSIIMDISSDFRPFLYIYSKGRIIYSKEFNKADDGADFNMEDGQVFIVNEDFEFDTDIPEGYADISISDETVLKEVYTGIYRFLKEGSTTVTLTNRISGKSRTVTVECRKIHMFAKIRSAYSIIFDYYMTFNVSIRGLRIGPGTFYLENTLSGNRTVVTEVSEMTNYLNFVTFKVSDRTPMDPAWTEAMKKPKKYRLVYEGSLNGKDTTYETDWDVWAEGI